MFLMQVPRYTWNIANVGVKHQSINQYLMQYNMINKNRGRLSLNDLYQ